MTNAGNASITPNRWRWSQSGSSLAYVACRRACMSQWNRFPNPRNCTCPLSPLYLTKKLPLGSHFPNFTTMVLNLLSFETLILYYNSEPHLIFLAGSLKKWTCLVRSFPAKNRGSISLRKRWQILSLTDGESRKLLSMRKPSLVNALEKQIIKAIVTALPVQTSTTLTTIISRLYWLVTTQVR